jgi:hypothetical protein
VVGIFWRTEPVTIERVEVARGADREFLDLSLRHVRATLLPDQLDDFVERCARGLLGDDSTHLVRVLLVR